MDTDIQFYHVPTHADASRKRITEDTEDWRPRTGTTQSKSFRILAQITGTENGMMSTNHSLINVMIKASSKHGFQQWKHCVFLLFLLVQEQEAEAAKKKK